MYIILSILSGLKSEYINNNFFFLKYAGNSKLFFCYFLFHESLNSSIINQFVNEVF